MWGPSDPVTFKRNTPWNPMSMGVLLFDIQTMKVLDSIPFATTAVYCNGNKRYIEYDTQINEWRFPIALLHMKQENGEYPYIWSPLKEWPKWVPKEVLAMAMLLKG